MATGRKLPTGAAMASKLLARAAVAGADWKAGVTNPSRDPVQAGIDSAGKWAAKTQAAIANKAFEAGLRHVDKGAMAATIAATPDSAVSDGLNRRAAKVQGAFNKLQPLLQAVSDETQAMPNATDADNEARMLKNLRGMRAIKAKFRAS